MMARNVALSVVAAGRGVQRRQAERLLRDGDGPYWEVSHGRVRLHGLHRLSTALGVERTSRAHLVPLDQMHGGLASVRAAIMAAVYRVDEDGTPVARRRLAEITGVPVSTQRRYDARFRTSALVARVSVRPSTPPVSTRGSPRRTGTSGRARNRARSGRHGNVRCANQLSEPAEERLAEPA
jgi:hypothetical protein